MRVWGPSEIIDRARLWQRALGLDHWSIDLTVRRMGDNEGIANARMMPEYRKGTITFDPYNILDDDLDAYICHEFHHAFTWRFVAAGEALAAELGGDDRRETLRFEEENMTEALADLAYAYIKPTLPPLDEDDED